MQRLTREQGYQLALARSAANDAIRAVALQRDRINDRDDDAYFAAAGFRQEVDVAFQLIALRWLREACQLIADLTEDGGLVSALIDFDRRLPGARDMRDVREHIPDYIRGSGRLQAATTAPDRLVPPESIGKRTWLGHDELSHFIWAGKEIRLDDALPAAEGLFQAMREAIDPFLVRHSNGDESIRVLVGFRPSWSRMSAPGYDRPTSRQAMAGCATSRSHISEASM
jgi:hypothetical protein